MKKIGIALIAIATLTLGYLYFWGCCPETCCKTATECQQPNKSETAVFTVTDSE